MYPVADQRADDKAELQLVPRPTPVPGPDDGTEIFASGSRAVGLLWRGLLDRLGSPDRYLVRERPGRAGPGAQGSDGKRDGPGAGPRRAGPGSPDRCAASSSTST